MTPFSDSGDNEELSASRKLLLERPSFVWKRFADGAELRVWMFAPPGHTASAFMPAVMFFHGGMWAVDFGEEFISWALHLSARGIVCLIPEYRTHACYDVSANDIIQDGLDAWRWIHHNANGLGIDQYSITLAGADAGGLMALNAAMQPMLQTRRWWKVGSKDELPLQPACVAIFRGILDVHAPEARLLNIKTEVTNPDSINPCALLRRYLPPLFCAHGLVDPLQDYAMREWFCDEWRSLGNEAELVLCPGGDHTLAQFSVNPTVFELILLAWENFMAEQGIWPASAVEESALMS